MDGHVAGHHDDRHGLAHGPSDAQNNTGEDAGFGSGHGGAIDAALMGCPQGQAALIIAGGYGAQGGLRHANDGGENHDAQQYGGGENALPAGAGEVLHERNEDDQPKKAIDNGGDTRHQIQYGLNEAVEAPGAEECHEHGAEDADGHADGNGRRQSHRCCPVSWEECQIRRRWAARPDRRGTGQSRSPGRAGQALEKRKTQIKTTARIEAQAVARKTPCMVFSRRELIDDTPFFVKLGAESFRARVFACSEFCHWTSAQVVTSPR